MFIATADPTTLAQLFGQPIVYKHFIPAGLLKLEL
jgi:hypothetical protein